MSREQQPIEFPNDNGVEEPLLCIRHETIQFGTGVFSSGHATFDVFALNSPVSSLTVFAQFGDLRRTPTLPPISLTSGGATCHRRRRSRFPEATSKRAREWYWSNPTP